MKNMKKALAAMLAGTMVMGMSSTAWATSVEPADTTRPNFGKTEDFTDDGTIVIKKTYDVNSFDALYPAETFEFTIEAGAVLAEGEDKTYVTDSDLDNVAASCGVPTIGNVAFDARQEDDEILTKNVTVTLPEYTKVGIYYYTINETAGDTAGVDYYGEPIILKVTVVQQGVDQVRVAAVHTERPYTSGTASKTNGITNTYSAGRLSVFKSVTGNMGDQEKDFNVKVTFTAPADRSVDSTISYMDGDEEKTIAPSVWALAEGATNKTATAEITLKHTETVTFFNIPYGVTYDVVEDDYTGEGYDAAKYDFYDEGKKIDSIVDMVQITNNKTSAVDTGIDLDSIPYIMILGVAALGMGAFVAKKRKDEDLF